MKEVKGTHNANFEHMVNWLLSAIHHVHWNPKASTASSPKYQELWGQSGRQAMIW